MDNTVLAFDSLPIWKLELLLRKFAHPVAHAWWIGEDYLEHALRIAGSTGLVLSHAPVSLVQIIVLLMRRVYLIHQMLLKWLWWTIVVIVLNKFRGCWTRHAAIINMFGFINFDHLAICRINLVQCERGVPMRPLQPRRLPWCIHIYWKIKWILNCLFK